MLPEAIRSPSVWVSLIAATFATILPLRPADNATTAPDGSKTVSVNLGGGKTLPIKVIDQRDPYRNVSSPDSTGKYDPERIFSTSSSYANKTFSFPTSSITASNSDYKDRDQNTFITKSYLADASAATAPNLNKKADLTTASAYDQNAAEFNRSFATSESEMGRAHPAVLASSNTSADQDRTAVLGGPAKPEGLVYDTNFNKSYLGPGAQHVPEGVTIKDNIILSRMSGLPNRPLSIDEVRNLINHQVKPNLDEKPEEPSKPLNDPDYKPEPLRDTPAPDSPSASTDDDKNDPVPPPGTMAVPPENSQPLPQP